MGAGLFIGFFVFAGKDEQGGDDPGAIVDAPGTGRAVRRIFEEAQ